MKAKFRGRRSSTSDSFNWSIDRHLIPVDCRTHRCHACMQCNSRTKSSLDFLKCGNTLVALPESIVMSFNVPKVKLNSGAEIPILGLGTWNSPPGVVAEAVRYAIAEGGYRQIDCAAGYGNEKEVGEGIRKSGVPRSEIFVTSKLWSTWHSRVEEALDKSLSDLGLDYLDLYLIHWPVPLNPNGNHPLFPTLSDGTRDVDYSWSIADTWKQMEEMVKKGKTRSIGVSNFSQKKLEEILPTATIVPAVDQLELHLYNPQHKLLEYLRSKGIQPQAYSPLGSTGSPLLSDELAQELALKYGVEPAHILLAYLVRKNIVTIVKSVTPGRITSNLTGTLRAVPQLTAEDMENLDGIAASGKQKRFITPPWVIDLGFDNWPKP